MKCKLKAQWWQQQQKNQKIPTRMTKMKNAVPSLAAYVAQLEFSYFSGGSQN